MAVNYRLVYEKRQKERDALQPGTPEWFKAQKKVVEAFYRLYRRHFNLGKEDM